VPSRRAALRSVGAATAVGLAGCSVLDRGADGYVQLKSITGVQVTEGERVDDSVLRVSLASPPGSAAPDVDSLAEDWTDAFETPARPVVTDETAAALDRAYDEVRYVVGVCCPEWADDGEHIGCYNVRTTRENFNAVQVHQRVRASSDGTYLTIHSTDGQWQFESTEDET
jgi:hypothetical protein